MLSRPPVACGPQSSSAGAAKAWHPTGTLLCGRPINQGDDFRVWGLALAFVGVAVSVLRHSRGLRSTLQSATPGIGPDAFANGLGLRYPGPGRAGRAAGGRPSGRSVVPGRTL